MQFETFRSVFNSCAQKCHCQWAYTRDSTRFYFEPSVAKYNNSIHRLIYDCGGGYTSLRTLGIGTDDNFMPSIRQKISFGFYAFVAIVAFLALFAYSDLRYLEQRIGSGVTIYEFLDAVLEVRLQEKDFFLYANERNLQSALDYAGKAEAILKANRQAFLALQTDTELLAMESLLREYIQGWSRHRNLTTGGGLSAEQAKNSLRQMGERLTDVAEMLAKAERVELSTSVSHSQWALMASVAIIALLGIVAARLLSRVSLRPLAWLEAKLAAIGDGRYNQLDPVSRDQEIVSMSRAVNRMLNDIEVRNRHLMQSEKLVSLGTLASGVAHELNNPLSNISSSCQILMEEIKQSSRTDPMEWLEQIDQETERARLIVQAVLEFSKENHIRKAPVDLHEIIGKSLLLIGQKDNFRIRTSEVPKKTILHADAQKLQQIFINLFQNAVDAGGPNVRIGVRSRTMAGKDFKLPDGMVSGKGFCAANPDGRVLIVEVDDDGPGIPPEVLPRVFDPFFTTKDVGHGDGLGLYVTQEIIDLHGGCIGVGNRPGLGARFVICLPCEEEKKELAPPEAG